ncbi:serine/threonine-protein kinase [Streptomyces shenzhenensis]|uniref:non-specific serine/threonine protein kinase n=1 Tax=Streptomyces shenzhenensis TaxID=943815 RepID=A0A3M0IEC8_9ACTN|nr:serine/threonine-protein kinase [Streptomyces shenzhenensis]RMB87881.1 serine/threonine protein kinase [Streptomyces shenzhenensis]
MQGLLIAGRYRLVDSIGSGGMGRVWRAHDEVLHRSVAIKELTAALYVSDSDQAVLLARTRAEARAAARINHSAVVTVHDVLEHDGRPWIVMELVEGSSLADTVKERDRVEPQEAARIGLWVLRALRAAHAAGVLHRDVKPGNVLLGRDNRVLLTDFGIAQIEGDSTITRTGEVVGSVDYLAPERVRGHDPGPASDLWALGATLYTAVEGRSPFRRTSPLSTMQAVVEDEAAEPRYAGPLGPVITALLRKDPEDRPDAAAAEQMLAEAAEGRRPGAAQAFVPTRNVASHPPEHIEYGSATGAPYGTDPATPPLTGPTVPTPAVPPARPPRRRLRTLALVVVVAALAGGAAAVALQQWGTGRHNDGATVTTPDPTDSATATPTATPSVTPTEDATLPADWQTVNDPLGFTLSLPKDWKRQVYGMEGDLKQVDYTPDGGLHFVRVSIDGSPDFADPFQHQQDLEQQLQRLVDYERVTMKENTYRDRQGALWEYTWTALKKDPPYVPGPRHAIEETYIGRNGAEYAIYMSSPAADWATTSRQFTWVLQSWQPPEG